MMGQRWLKWLLVTAVLIVAVVGVRRCVDGGGERGGNVPSPAPGASPSGDAASTVGSAADAAQLAGSQQRTEAMSAAVSELQRYLTALPGEDRSKADAFWAGGKPPGNTHEADLRSLRNIRGMRIDSGLPVALDSTAIPAALEIPVTLRVNPENGPMQRYRGWYRLRRAVADGRWEITSASVDPMPPGQ